MSPIRVKGDRKKLYSIDQIKNDLDVNNLSIWQKLYQNILIIYNMLEII